MTTLIKKIKETFTGASAETATTTDTCEPLETETTDSEENRDDTANGTNVAETDTKDIEDTLRDTSIATNGGEVDDDKGTDIVKVDVELPRDFKGRLAFVLYNVLTEKECKDYIKITEKKGYEEALVNVGYGMQRSIPSVRNNKRCIWDTFEESGLIWDRIKAYVPKVWKGRKVMGLNERLRFLKYVPGQFFKEHMDGMYQRENGERSFITVQVYLNEGFKGGSTTFLSYNLKERFEVVPKTGSVLVFQHDIMHEGSELKEGTKYTVRTDVMYAATKTE